eukprot:2431306-Karenia_brevis.AAC.1
MQTTTDAETVAEILSGLAIAETCLLFHNQYIRLRIDKPTTMTPALSLTRFHQLGLNTGERQVPATSRETNNESTEDAAETPGSQRKRQRSPA